MLPWMLAGMAVICGVAALVIAPSRSPGPRVTGAITAPVLSARRLPTALTSLVGDLRLAQSLNATLANPSVAGGPDTNCMEVRMGAAIIYAHRPDVSLVPASNQKLLTALAVANRLGPDSHLSTEARSSGPPSDGVINGPLWLVGGGDPLLVTAAYRPSQREFTWSAEPASHLDDLADKIARSGVRTITGSVTGDDSRYDSQRSLPTWRPSYLATGEIGAVGALVVNGGFTGATKRVPSRSPARTAATELTALLVARGVQVGGLPAVGTAAPDTTVIASLPSLTIAQILSVMLKESDNLGAEMLTKELGHRFGSAGSWSAGLAVARETLVGLGLPTDGLVMSDGSGLDRGNRSRCTTFASVMSVSGPGTAAVIAGLPVAAREGTLVHRMVGQPPAGRLRAKTGALSGVAALSGFIDPPSPSPDNAPPAFSLLANGLASDTAGRALEDRIATILAAYPQAPTPDGLAPRDA